MANFPLKSSGEGIERSRKAKRAAESASALEGKQKLASATKADNCCMSRCIVRDLVSSSDFEYFPLMH